MSEIEKQQVIIVYGKRNGEVVHCKVYHYPKEGADAYEDFIRLTEMPNDVIEDCHMMCIDKLFDYML